MSGPSRVYWWLRQVEPWSILLSNLRRTRIRLALPLIAFWYRASVSVTIAPSARLGRRLRLVVAPGTSSTLVVGERTIVGDDVRIILEGGSLEIGPGCDLRRMATLVVGGRLVLEGRNVLQTGVSLHCAEELIVGVRTGIGEYSTVVDSSHYYSAPGSGPRQPLAAAPDWGTMWWWGPTPW
jgi:hypothetical protein